MSGMGLALARPEALWLLVLLPVILLAGWRFGARGRLGRWGTVARTGVIALLILGLAEPLLVTSQAAHSTIFVIDRSESIDASVSAQVTTWLNDALATAGSHDRAAVIEFGAGAVLTHPLTPAGAMPPLELAADDVDPRVTNIEAALTLARSLPVDGSRTIVLASDGAETVGHADEHVALAAAAGIAIDVLPLPGIAEGGAMLTAVSAPASVWSGETANLLLTAQSATDTIGELTVRIDGDAADTVRIELPAGVSTHAVELTDLQPGFHVVEVSIRNERGDTPPGTARTVGVLVRDTPSALLISPDRTDSSFLSAALERQQVDVSEVTPDRIPERLSTLTAYDVVILNNVPAGDLTVNQVAALDALTREFGRGLVVIGGTAAYGPGGYARTPLEAMLPVTVKVTEGRERQRVALMLILDKSGSMAYDPLQTTSKIEMAKEAVRLAVDFLSDGDEVGILVFNDKQHWVVRLTAIEGPEVRERIHAAIDQITADGGTEIYPALDVGFAEIIKSDADVRHVVLLSDGKSATGTREAYERLITDMRNASTTLSTIAIGDDADTDLLQFMAELGYGNYHAAERAEEIPAFTLAEAESAGSQSVIRGSFAPIQVAPSPILSAFDPEELPLLSGYDYATPKSDAQVVLTSSRNDPLLAKWQYGLGRVVAWTGDDGVDFANEWRDWSRFDEFWSGVIRWSLPDPESGQIAMDVERDGTDVLLTFDARREIGDYVDLSVANVTIAGANGVSSEGLSPYLVGPGRYQLRIADPEPGTYQVTVDLGPDGTQRPSILGFTVPPSLELFPHPEAAAWLQDVAQRTGGRELRLDEPSAVFGNRPVADAQSLSYRPVWWIAFIAALGLLLLELAARYGVVNQVWSLRRQRR